VNRGSGLGTADRRAAGTACSPRPHLGDERRELPSETEQTQARLTAELLIRPPPASNSRPPRRRTCRGEEGVFRSGVNAPPFRRRRPPLQTPSSPTIPNLLPVALVYLYSASVVWFYSALDRSRLRIRCFQPKRGSSPSVGQHGGSFASIGVWSARSPA
jgi:hypothetical protein